MIRCDGNLTSRCKSMAYTKYFLPGVSLLFPLKFSRGVLLGYNRKYAASLIFYSDFLSSAALGMAPVRSIRLPAHCPQFVGPPTPIQEPLRSCIQAAISLCLFAYPFPSAKDALHLHCASAIPKALDFRYRRHQSPATPDYLLASICQEWEL